MKEEKLKEAGIKSISLISEKGFKPKILLSLEDGSIETQDMKSEMVSEKDIQDFFDRVVSEIVDRKLENKSKKRIDTIDNILEE